MRSMRKTKLRKADRAAIGIGTLIVFIAMVLVAAIAAAVIIRTAEGLEEDAERTGTGARQDVSGSLRVRLVEGRITDQDDGYVDELYIYFNLYGGSQDIQMEEVIIHLLLTPRVGQPAQAYDLKFVDGEDNANDTLYGVKAVNDPLGTYASSQVLDGSSILRARIILRDPPEGVGRMLPTDSEVLILMMPTTGGPATTEELTTPAAYPPEDGSWIVLES